MTEEKQIGFLEEDNGHKSTMRAMCFTSLIAAIIFGGLTIYLQDKGSGLYITTMFLIGAFAPKYLQKFVESKNLK